MDPTQRISACCIADVKLPFLLRWDARRLDTNLGGTSFTFGSGLLVNEFMIVASEVQRAESRLSLLCSVERRTHRALCSISPIMEEPSLCGKLHGLAYLCAPTGGSLADDGTPERTRRPRCGLTGCEGNRPGQSEPVDPIGGWCGSDRLGTGAVCGEAFWQQATVTERNADNIPTGTQGASPLRQAARCGPRAASVER